MKSFACAGLALVLGACTPGSEHQTHSGAEDMTATQIYKSEQAGKRIHELYREILASWPVAHEEKTVATRFGDTFVVASGPRDAPGVVLLHGTMATAAMWRDEVQTLASDHRVYAVDVIGDAGFSAPVRPPVSTDAHALWLNDVLDALGVPGAHVVGLSLGGWLAIDLAARYPERVHSLTLITPGGVADKNVIIWALPLMMLGSWGTQKVMERILGPAPEVVTRDQQQVAALSAAIFQGMQPRSGLRTFSDEELAALDMPVLVLLGADDVTMDSAKIEGRFRQLAPHSEVKTFPGVRHFLGNQSEAIHRFLHGVASVQR